MEFALERARHARPSADEGMLADNEPPGAQLAGAVVTISAIAPMPHHTCAVRTNDIDVIDARFNADRTAHARSR